MKSRQDYIEELLLEKAIIDDYIAILTKYPYIKVKQSTYKDILLYCQEVNSIVDSVDIYENLNKHNEHVLYASPYIIINNIPVYSNPYFFEVGFANFYGEGYFKNPDWQKDLLLNNIPSKVISIVEQYLIDNKAIYLKSELYFKPKNS